MAKNKDEKPQSERFIEKAKELGADKSAEAFERAFTKVVPPSDESGKRFKSEMKGVSSARTPPSKRSSD